MVARRIMLSMLHVSRASTLAIWSRMSHSRSLPMLSTPYLLVTPQHAEYMSLLTITLAAQQQTMASTRIALSPSLRT